MSGDSQTNVYSVRPSLDQYEAWHNEKFSGEVLSRSSRQSFEMSMKSAYGLVTDGKFFRNFVSCITKIADEYHELNGCRLLMSELKEHGLQSKSFESVVNKCYRINVLENKLYPQNPECGWVTLGKAYEVMNDLVRGRIVCKFIDGPQFLADKLQKYATSLNLKSEIKTHQKDGGYYAYHFYVAIPVTVIDEQRNFVDVSMKVEVQLTTQLQEVLCDLTHELYEALRVQEEKTNLPWQWDYSSARFKPSFMGHTLHMLEAIILEVRDNNRAKK